MLIRCLGAALLITIILLCTGCYGSKETDDVAYTLVIGLDKTKDGKARVTTQTAVPRAISGANPDPGEKGSSQKGAWVLNTIVTPSPAEESSLLVSTMSRVPRIDHVTVMIFSEEVALEGLDPHVFHLIRSRDYRETLFLIVVSGTAEEYIKRNKPTLETSISKFYEVFLASASASGYYLPATLHDFYTRLKSNGASPYAVYSGINPMTGVDKPAGTKTSEQKGAPYLPGGIPRTGTENPVDFAGLAVFRGGKMVGVLNSDETRAVAILLGKLTNGYIGVVDPLQQRKDAINLSVRTDSKPKITATFDDGIPGFNVDVQIEGEILAITSNINYEAPGYRELLEAQVANLLKDQIMTMIQHTQQLGTDPVGFGLYLRPLFHSTQELDQADLTALYQAADIRVNVTVKVRRTGREWRSSPNRKE